MADSTLNYFVASGTNAERLAFTPSPPSPSNAPPHPGYFFYETDTGNTYSWDGAVWQPVGSGSGGVDISAGTQTATSGTVIFSNGNGVSFGMAGSATVTATVKTAYAGLNSAITGGSLTVNSSGISINLPAYLTTAMASNRGTDFVQATAAFAGTNASGTIASGGISVSVAAPGAGASINFSAGTTSNNLSQVSFKNTNGVSFGLDAGTITATVQTNYLTTAMASNRGTDFVQATAAFAGTNASGTIASNGISVSVAAPGAGASVNFSAGTTSNNLSQVSFKNTNGVSFGLDAGTITATVKTDYQTSGAYLTTAALSGDTSKYVQAWEITGNTAGTTSSAQGTKLYFSGGANVTLSGNSNTIVVSAASGGGGGSVNFSAGTTSGNLASVVFSNSNAITFGLSGSTITASANTTSYNTVGIATTVNPVASANSVGTVTRWAPEDHKHAGIGAIGISTGNTSGTSGSVQGTYWFSGAGGLTISQITSNNGSHTLVLSDNQPGYNGWLEPYPLQTATQSFAPGAGTWYLAPFTAFGSMSGGRINFLAQNTGTANLFLDIGETAYVSSSTGGIQQSYTYQFNVALFSQGTGANSTRLESNWSNSFSFGWSKSLSISTNAATNIAVSLAQSVSYISEIGSNGAYTNVQYANAGSSTIANSSGNSTLLSTVFSSGRNLLSGSIVMPVGLTTTLTAGIYWLGYAWSSTRARASTGNLTTGSDFSFGGVVGMSRLAVDSLYRNFGSTASTARSQLIPYGLYTAAANMTPPTNIALSSDLSSLASQFVPYFNMAYRGLTK